MPTKDEVVEALRATEGHVLVFLPGVGGEDEARAGARSFVRTLKRKILTLPDHVIDALGDGLERALSRAGELEVMIHNEVTALERTYSDNESRMRALIQELASQRDSVAPEPV